MDYSQLSDFEINVAVFEAIHNGSPDYKEGENGAMVSILKLQFWHITGWLEFAERE